MFLLVDLLVVQELMKNSEVKSPECNALRIVKDRVVENKYALEIYQCYPGWADLGRGNLTLSEARKRIKYLDEAQKPREEIK